MYPLQLHSTKKNQEKRAYLRRRHRNWHCSMPSKRFDYAVCGRNPSQSIAYATTNLGGPGEKPISVGGAERSVQSVGSEFEAVRQWPMASCPMEMSGFLHGLTCVGCVLRVVGGAGGRGLSGSSCTATAANGGAPTHRTAPNRVNECALFLCQRMGSVGGRTAVRRLGGIASARGKVY